jgi:hypothetical protein
VFVDLVVGVPDVAAAKSGYRLLAVLVSLDSEAPALTVAQEVFVPSVVRYLPDCEVWLGARALKAVLAVVWPVVLVAVTLRD